jgi:hypothetical protein
LDVFTQDPLWARWSEEELIVHAERDLLAINPIIYAEVSVHFSTLEELDEVLSPIDFQRLPLPYEAGFGSVNSRRLPLSDLFSFRAVNHSRSRSLKPAAVE